MIDVSELPRPVTPGPWTVAWDPDAVRVRQLRGIQYVVIMVGSPGPVETDQDAEAIAALPTLWEALDERDAEIARLRLQVERLGHETAELHRGVCPGQEEDSRALVNFAAQVETLEAEIARLREVIEDYKRAHNAIRSEAT